MSNDAFKGSTSSKNSFTCCTDIKKRTVGIVQHEEMQ